MAATHHLDISLTMDDIGWHFLNFGEPGLVRETEAGLRELGLGDIADYFVEAQAIVSPLKPEIKEAGPNPETALAATSPQRSHRSCGMERRVWPGSC